jgi:hypothetical protein
MAEKTAKAGEQLLDRELMIAERYPAAASAVERVFKRLCPTLDLLNFNAQHSDGGRCTRGFHWICFSGSETELLEFGLVTAAMLPVRPKRVSRGHINDDSDYFYSVARRAGGRFEVFLNLSDSLPRSHVLAPLATYSWPFVDTERARPSLRIVVNNEFAGGCTP